MTLYSQNNLYATIKTTSTHANKRSKQKINDKRLNVSLLFRLSLRNKPSGAFETALGDKPVCQILTTPVTPRTLTPPLLMTQKRLRLPNPLAIQNLDQ
jgi:hypothetical protein